MMRSSEVEISDYLKEDQHKSTKSSKITFLKI